MLVTDAEHLNSNFWTARAKQHITASLLTPRNGFISLPSPSPVIKSNQKGQRDNRYHPILKKSNKCNRYAPPYLHDRQRKVDDRDGSRQTAVRRFASPHACIYHRSSAWHLGPSEKPSQFCRSNTPTLHLKLVEWRIPFSTEHERFISSKVFHPLPSSSTTMAKDPHFSILP